MPKLAQKNTTYKLQKDNTITVTDLMEGTAQLTASGALEITDIVEAIHKEIVLQPFKLISIAFNTEKTYSCAETVYKHTTGRIYSVIKSIAQVSGDNTAKTLRAIDASFPKILQEKKLSVPSQHVISAMNGLMGDHLVDMDNPLAIPMNIYNHHGNLHTLQHLSSHVVIFTHGLCMSYLGWYPKSYNGLGKLIKRNFKHANILYLNYNTGKRISENGEEFSEMLTKILANNPQIQRIDLIGHSMGGLVSRSALYYGKKNEAEWVKRVHTLVTLCSPHHGAILERIGFFVQESLSRVPVAGNFSRLGNLRSAGIIDLRYGNVRHQDWQQDDDRMGELTDSRTLAPLPKGITTYLVAASLDLEPKDNYNEITGDGLVSVSSALGERYVDYYGYYNLQVPEEQKVIFYNMNHMSVLLSKKVHKNVVKWLRNTRRST